MPAQSPEALLETLDPEQREVAATLHGPVQVIAGAGTGKTRAVTTRIAYGIATGTYAPSQVLAVTFTTKAAGEMRDRLERLGASGVAVHTFHAAALRQVRHFWPLLTGVGVPEIRADVSGLLREAASRSGCRARPGDVGTEVTWAKSSNVAPEDYVRCAAAAGREVSGADLEEIAATYADYEVLKRSSQLWDMQDVLLAAVGVLSSRPDLAARVRQVYRTFVVDEFQDASAVQVRLLSLWLGERRELCVVGDPNQTIYTFAGARPSFLTDLGTVVSDPRVLRLWRSYRSTPQIVDCASRVLASGRPGLGELVSQRSRGSDVRVLAFPDEHKEAQGVARAVLEHVRGGVRLTDIAVLLRTHRQADPIVRALREEGLGSVVVGSAGGGTAAAAAEGVPRRAAPVGGGPPVGAPAVTVSTVHAAKGNEWSVVCMPGLNEGTFPTRAASRPGREAELAEERRLAYVGMTRARDHLVLSHHAGGSSARSRFLDHVVSARRRSVGVGD